MALSTDEFIDRLKNLLANFSDEIDIVLLSISEDTKDSIVQRIQEKGLNFNNASFEDYSTLYKIEKTKKGKYSGKVDLTLTGEMWRSTGIVGEPKDNTVTIAGRDVFTQNKLNWNSNLRGDLLEITDEELKYITETFDEELELIIEKYLNE